MLSRTFALVAALFVLAPATALADDCQIESAWKTSKGPFWSVYTEVDVSPWFAGGSTAMPTKRRYYSRVQSAGERLRLMALRGKPIIAPIEPSTPAGANVKTLMLKGLDLYAAAGRAYAQSMVHATRGEMKKARRLWRLAVRAIHLIGDAFSGEQTVLGAMYAAQVDMQLDDCPPIS